MSEAFWIVLSGCLLLAIVSLLLRLNRLEKRRRLGAPGPEPGIIQKTFISPASFSLLRAGLTRIAPSNSPENAVEFAEQWRGKWSESFERE